MAGEPGHPRTTESIYERTVVMHDILVKYTLLYAYMYVHASVTSNPLACKQDCHILHDGTESSFIRYSRRMHLFINENWMFRMEYDKHIFQTFFYLKA